jgi:uncharacterized integral membrane protein (TIGR00698 family)
MTVRPDPAELDGTACGNSATDRARAVGIAAIVSPLVPGLALTAAIAVAATLLRGLPGMSILSAMILAAIIGMAIRNAFGIDKRLGAGIGFSMRLPLRTAIVLLGLQLTLAQLASIGAEAFVVVALSLIATFVFVIAVGRAIRTDKGLTYLLAIGISICGAAAIVAGNSVVRAKDGDVFYALGCITLFGTIVMFLYPPLAAAFGLAPAAFGIWAGASIHEVAQVVGASFQYGQMAGEIGTISKLTRVLMLAPMVLLLPFLMPRPNADLAAEAKLPVPWFVFGFVAMVGLSSLVHFPVSITAMAGQVTTFLLAVALAAMGLETDLRLLNSRGFRPLLLAGAGTVFISVFSFLLIKILMT